MIELQSKARDAAVLALRDQHGNVSARLEHLLADEHLKPADRALAREMTFGVLRRRATLRRLLRGYLKQPGKTIPGVLNEILLVAIYQLVFLDRVPDFAAVDEAVEQSIRFHHKRQSGFVNGVLRSIARGLGPLQAGKPTSRTDCIPVDAGHYRCSDHAVFADPDQDPSTYLSDAYSLPRELAERWLSRLGSLDAAVARACHAASRPPLILRINRLRAEIDGVEASLRGEGLDPLRHVDGRSLVLSAGTDIRALACFREGWVQPQDASAMEVALAAAPPPGGRVLDLCAAPGTKTTHLAELMDDRGEALAADVSEDKLGRITENCRRLGIHIVSTTLSEQLGGCEPASFDRVLADVPCSNTGVLARRPEARWRFDPSRLGRLAADQRDLLGLAVAMCRPGGRVIYSTCSVEPEENGQVVRSVLAAARNLTLVAENESVPDGANDPARWRDGGYHAILAVS
jgi:16S rRNA (cytosine967-C5)-methyltransferase